MLGKRIIIIIIIFIISTDLPEYAGALRWKEIVTFKFYI